MAVPLEKDRLHAGAVAARRQPQNDGAKVRISSARMTIGWPGAAPAAQRAAAISPACRQSEA